MMADALDQPCPVCDARVAEWCIDGPGFAHIHLVRADLVPWPGNRQCPRQVGG